MAEEPKEQVASEPESEEEEKSYQTPEEIKAEIIEKHGLDEEADGELIGSLLKDKLHDRKGFNQLFKKAKTLEEKVEAFKKPEEPEKAKEEVAPPKSTDVDLDKKLDEVLNKRDLDSLDVSDDTKKAIEFVMNRDGCSAKKAQEDGVVKYHLQQDEEKAKTDEASISTSPKGQATTDFSGIKTQEDLSAEIKKLGALDTEEKRKKYQELISKTDYKNLK